MATDYDELQDYLEVIAELGLDEAREVCEAEGVDMSPSSATELEEKEEEELSVLRRRLVAHVTAQFYGSHQQPPPPPPGVESEPSSRGSDEGTP